MGKIVKAKKRRWALVGGLLAMAAVCGWAAFGPGTRIEDKSSEKLVTAREGGKVESPSGKARLVVPAGALQSDTRLSIREVAADDLLAVGPTFDIRPEGLKFLKPATLTVRFASKEVPGEYSPEDLALSGEGAEPQKTTSLAGGAPGAVPQTSLASLSAAAASFGGLFFLDTTVDVGSGTASAQVVHLSKYVLRAVSSYRLGDEQEFIHGVKRFFNIILPIRNLQGKATRATGTCNSQGEFFISVCVPLGQEGLAVGEAVGTKFFRVKPWSKALKELGSVVEVEFIHNAQIEKETNFYNIGYSLSLGEALPGQWAFMGRPAYYPVYARGGRDLPVSRISNGLKYPGTMTLEGIYNRAFSLHPLIKMMDFPMGPEYPKSPTLAQDREHASVQKHIVAFQNCRFTAGRVYGLVISFHALVNGFKPGPSFPVGMGGDVMFSAQVVRMTIKAQL